jgi:threonine aldolase
MASGVDLATYGAMFETMSVCLSKGLGAPVGSLVVVRDAGLADTAREIRHQLGGAMRQAGVIAAGGLHALRHHIGRLADDHARAKALATRIAAVAPAVVDPDSVETNIVVLDLATAPVDTAMLDETCRAAGVYISPLAPRRVRLVTHLDIDDDGIDRAVEVITKALA